MTLFTATINPTIERYDDSDISKESRLSNTQQK